MQLRTKPANMASPVGSDRSVADAARLPLCISQMLELQADRHPDGIAICAPGRSPLTFLRLLAHQRDVVRAIHTMGLGRHDRVAIVLPNGPEMATTFLAVAGATTCAPLNPACRADEFEFYLSNLGVTALIVQADAASPAIDVAQKLRLPVIRISPLSDAEAGIFAMESGRVLRPRAGEGVATPQDVGLVLHTSGTTSRPKIVRLTHRNICTSAESIGKALQLSSDDRCLNVMPLFHVHGLIGATLSSLAAGASVVCTPGLHPARFFDWMDEFQPSWYTAVPTIHQTVLARAAHHREIVERRRFRFIRSSSSALPPTLMAELERVFKAPVIEAYGMTEASHQMASNPLPPGSRKPGSVGVSAGSEIGTMDEAGHLLPPGHTGEIVVRGANVIHSYENNASANSSAFTNGWFRTGDQGLLDADGYLFVTGRLKEIINRGGEKISPREVDEVLLDHPAIAQAVTFPTPHPTLGEDVAVAVVLRDHAVATEAEVRRFAATRLADFKVPRQVVILPELPKGSTGKLQRLGLAERLGLVAGTDQPTRSGESVPPAAGTSPRDDVEGRLAKIWERVLGVQPIGVNQNFFDLGGYSLLAAELVEEVAKEFGTNLPLATLLRAPSVEQQARIIRTNAGSEAWACLLPIKPGGSRPPFYCVHTVGGNILGYRALANHLAPDQPVYGLQAIGLDGTQVPYTTIEEMASHYVRETRAFQPVGPYFLGGLSFGGTVAFEMARQLQEQGQRVAVLALFDTVRPGDIRFVIDRESLPRRLAANLQRISYHATHLLRGPARLAYLGKRSRTARRKLKSLLWQLRFTVHQRSSRPLPLTLRRVAEANRQALKRYVPQPYSGKVSLFLASERGLKDRHDPTAMWERLASGGVEAWKVPGDHVSLIVEPQVRVLARELQACLNAGTAAQPSC